LDLISYINNVSSQFESAELFFGHGTDNAFDEAVFLVYGMLGLNFYHELHEVNRELQEWEIGMISEKVQQRIKKHEPVAYLLKQTLFAGLNFNCDKRALIPRSPIAELILNGFHPLLNSRPKRVLDLCTGSGCIGIAIANQFSECDVDLADIDESALELASSNVVLHGFGARVTTFQSDLFENLEGLYDLIVCNPPYISTYEYENLPEEYMAEPVLGLVGEEQGLAIPLRVLREAAHYLQPDGLLILEVGFSNELLSQRLAGVSIRWLEFENGGEGVLAMDSEELRQYSGEFN
jgi:ribosomal protein L3 glutamine methyltransferase